MLIASEVMKCSLPFNNCNSMIVTLFAICFNWPSPWKRYFVKKDYSKFSLGTLVFVHIL